jgi:hypothetical protein
VVNTRPIIPFQPGNYFFPSNVAFLIYTPQIIGITSANYTLLYSVADKFPNKFM